MAYKPDVQTWLTVNNEATLANERALAVGNNIVKSDGGAGGALTLQSFKSSNITGNTTLTTSSNTSQYADATSGAIAVTLPDAAGSSEKLYLVKKTDSSGNAVTVTRAGSDTIDGSNTYVLSAQNDWVIIQSNGTAVWRIVGRNYGASADAPADAQYLTLATNATLTNERVYTPGNNLFATDGGAGGNYTVNADQVSNVSSNTTLTNTSNSVQIVDDTAGTVTLTLPAATNTHKRFRVKKIGASNTVVIERAGSDTIDGATSFTLTGQYDAVDVICNGTNWFLF